MTEVITGIVSLFLGIFGKGFWDTRKSSSINKTKIELKELDLKLKSLEAEKLDHDTLIDQNKKLLEKINHLEVIIEKANSSFEMLITLLKEEFKEKPHIIKAFDQIAQNLKKK